MIARRAACALLLVAAQVHAEDEYIPPARRRQIQVPVEGDPAPRPTPTPAPELWPAAAAAPLEEYVPPGRRAPIVAPGSVPPSPQAAPSLVERVRFLSTVQAGTWTGYRYRGAGTGAAAGGVQVSATTPHGWKPSLMFGGDTLGLGVGRSRVGAGALWDGHHIEGLVYFQPVNF